MSIYPDVVITFFCVESTMLKQFVDYQFTFKVNRYNPIIYK